MKKTAKKITVKAEISVAKPLAAVFRAVLEPSPFFVERASGPMKAGKEILWEFPEFAGEFPIRVRKVEKNERIRFEWGRGEGPEMNLVEFRFKPFSKKITTVYVSETGWPADEAGHKAAAMNCSGWTHMICSLKAHLEYGVNLRKNAFVHMKF